MENPRPTDPCNAQSDPPALVSHSFYQSDNYQPEDSVGYMMRRILVSLAQNI